MFRADFTWIELVNTSNQVLSLDGVSIGGVIQFTFPPGMFELEVRKLY